MPIPSTQPKRKHLGSVGRPLEGISNIFILLCIISDPTYSASFDSNTATAGEEDFEVILD